MNNLKNKILIGFALLLLIGNVAFGYYLTQQIPKEVRAYVSTHRSDLKGDTGPKGDKGDKGDSGQNGADGKNGANGQAGATGKSGANGQDGANGCTWVYTVGWVCP